MFIYVTVMVWLHLCLLNLKQLQITPEAPLISPYGHWQKMLWFTTWQPTGLMRTTMYIPDYDLHIHHISTQLNTWATFETVLSITITTQTHVPSHLPHLISCASSQNFFKTKPCDESGLRGTASDLTFCHLWLATYSVVLQSCLLPLK